MSTAARVGALVLSISFCAHAASAAPPSGKGPARAVVGFFARNPLARGVAIVGLIVGAAHLGALWGEAQERTNFPEAFHLKNAIPSCTAAAESGAVCRSDAHRAGLETSLPLVRDGRIVGVAKVRENLGTTFFAMPRETGLLQQLARGITWRRGEPDVRPLTPAAHDLPDLPVQRVRGRHR